MSDDGVVSFELKRKEAADRATQPVFMLRGSMRCMSCKHEFEAEAPLGVQDFECEKCGLLQAKWRNPISPPANTKMWVCRCENDLFFITPDGIWCASCGLRAEFPF